MLKELSDTQKTVEVPAATFQRQIAVSPVLWETFIFAKNVLMYMSFPVQYFSFNTFFTVNLWERVW